MDRLLSRALTVIALALALTLLGATSTTATAAVNGDEQRLREAGIDPTTLAPGWRLVGRELQWNGGAVRATTVAAAYADCASGYMCFFEDKNYGGRLLQFNTTGLVGDMRTYSFNDQMSSLRSRRSSLTRWYFNYDGAGTSRCVSGQSANPDVGAGATNTDNDEMSSTRLYSSGTC